MRVTSFTKVKSNYLRDAQRVKSGSLQHYLSVINSWHVNMGLEKHTVGHVIQLLRHGSVRSKLKMMTEEEVVARRPIHITWFKIVRLTSRAWHGGSPERFSQGPCTWFKVLRWTSRTQRGGSPVRLENPRGPRSGSPSSGSTSGGTDGPERAAEPTPLAGVADVPFDHSAGVDRLCLLRLTIHQWLWERRVSTSLAL
jgi:hypothetical protein